jgi:hypothetical protein
MFMLPIRTWILTAAADFSGPHGAATRQVQHSRFSRQTVYEHACKPERRLADQPPTDATSSSLEDENQRLRQEIANPRRVVANLA